MCFGVNLWAVLVAGLVSFALGGLWYSPALFGKQWAKLSGMELKKDKDRGWRLFMHLVAMIVMAFVLAKVMFYVGVVSVLGGILAGAGLWLGFISTVTIGSFLWEKKPFTLYLLNNAYYLLSMIIMGIIIVVWV